MPHRAPSTFASAQPAEEDSLEIVHPWSSSTRLFFRLAFCYFSLSILFVSGVLTVLPFVGYSLQGALDQLRLIPVQWLAQHLFCLHGIAAHPHSADSRDTALDWVTLTMILTVAAIASVIWSFLDRRRSQYKVLGSNLHLVLRSTLIFLLFRYGFMKVFPLQMDPPSLAVLNEPLGNTSPLMLLWTLVGLHPAYEMLCGFIEVAAGVLLCFRRTATMGALLAWFVMTNVFLFNMFFDVPVKLGAANLLLLTLATLAPDARSLYRFLWQGKTAIIQRTNRAGGGSRSRVSVTRAFEGCFVLLALFRLVPAFAQAGSATRASLRHPSPLTGEWRVDDATLVTGHKSVPMPVLTAEGLPLAALFLEPNGTAMAQSSDGKLWRAAAAIDLPHRTFALSSGYFDGERFNTDYKFEQPDEQHLILYPMGADSQTHGTLQLSRVLLPQHYPLLDRGFHWVNEWGYRR